MKNNKICVYTCITGNYDEIQSFDEKEKNIDYLCFTNNKFLKSDFWKVIYIEDENLDNHMLSRKIKILGDPIIDKNYDISVWVDANISFKTKVSDFVKENLKNKSFASFKHHSRDCIYDEAEKCIEVRKDSKEKILETVSFLKKEKFPRKYGLTEMTVFIKKHNDKIVKDTMDLWYKMLSKYSKRDQLSFMYCVWKTGLDISYINQNVWDNKYFKHVKHNFSKKIDKCRFYFGDINNFNHDLSEEKEYIKNNDIYKVKTKVLEDTNIIRIDIANIPCVLFDNLNIKCAGLKSIEKLNCFPYCGKEVFYTPNGVVNIYGNFKKGSVLSLSIELLKMNDAEINDLLIYEHNENKKYNHELSDLRLELNKILNSKTWKMTKPFRSIIKKIKK